MMNPKIDLLREKYELNKPDHKPFVFLNRTAVCVLIFLAVFGAIFSYRVSTTTNQSTNKFSFFSAMSSLISPNQSLSGAQNDRINFLFMGIGGEGHDGPQLTDTLLFASYRPSQKKLAFLSIPRDLSVLIPGYGDQKINSANSYGEEQEKGKGPELATKIVGGILDQEIQYYIRVDFNGFEELINSIGGVDVYVDHTFTDFSYPILGQEDASCLEIGPTQSTYGCRYENLSFNEGWVHLDGTTALKFARSRHGNNGEGSDFARSRRQQKIIVAVKDKLFSFGTFANPLRISRILSTLNKNIATNLSISEMIDLAKQLQSVQTSEIVNHVLDSSPNSPLYSATVNGAFVLLPKNNDWTPIQKMAQYVFTPEPVIPEQKTVAETSIEENVKPQTIVVAPVEVKSVKVEIQNGTTVSGLAFNASQLLTSQGFDVIKIGNAETRDYKHTIIYDFSNGKKSQELKALKNFFSAEEVKSSVKDENIDFLVIIGENSENLARN